MAAQPQGPSQTKGSAIVVVLDLSYNASLENYVSARVATSALINVSCILSSIHRTSPKSLIAGVFYLAPSNGDRANLFEHATRHP